MDSEYGMQSPTRRFPTDAAMAIDRLVKVDANGFAQYAGAADANMVGCTQCDVNAAVPVANGMVVLLKGRGVCDVDIAAAEVLTVGSPCYQAASGKVAAAGANRAGIVLRINGTKAVIQLGA